MKRSVLLFLSFLFIGCGDDDSDPPMCPDGFRMEGVLCLPIDAGSDASAEGGMDAGPDGGSDEDAGDDTGGVDACVPSEELCNGLDDDCDGSTDEALTESCGTDVGTCVSGMRTCVAGEFGACEGEVTPSEEVCDGLLDEDCDGTPDNGCDCAAGTDRPCGETTGRCEAGLQTCGDDGTYGACIGATSAMAETCNNLDDDCDGTTDEGNPGGGASCGSDVGACVAGVETCTTGVIQCAGEVRATDETCNAADDDCDGTTDEGVTTTFYRDSDGDTRGDPLVRCEACAIGGCPGHVANSDDCNDSCSVCWSGRAEVCDGADNNCNGMTDEGVTTPYYRDQDGDGYGLMSAVMNRCSAPVGYIAARADMRFDCADQDSRAHPGATTYYSSQVLFRGGFDYNCSGMHEYSIPGPFTSDVCDLASCSSTVRWSLRQPACGSSEDTRTCRLFGSSCTTISGTAVAACR